MIHITNQEAFDNALFGLRKQGRACVSDDDESACLYADGRGGHCAVGFSIDRDHYDSSIEHEPLKELLEGGSWPMFKIEQHDLLCALQTAHDVILKGEGVGNWEQRMKTIAADFDVRYTEPEK
jgi:hypothetical protein